MSDIATIMWKEWKDALFQGGWQSWSRPVLLIGILGVVEPLLGKKNAWMSLSPLELVVFLWFAFFVIISIIADSFAGERERHTLETLLASRMPDRAILLGKVAIVVLYGWGVMVVGLFLGAGVYNLAHQEQPAFYPTDMLLFTLVLGLLVGTLGASAGVLLSLRIPTVRQAQQTLSIGTLVLGGVVIALLQLLPKEFFVTFTLDQILLMVVGLVVLLDVLLLAFTLARFQRAKLILS